MGSPKIKTVNSERNIGKEYEDTYKAKLKYADPMYQMERKYGIKYAQNTAI